ncbi:TlpA family protein disulfide reductase [Desulfovibrio mangrovi]|uniref:TlpA family protein disulfide reductase n=1 Tax=Desulfovibrio mangrovi TaxID=2976983 RepID=UPI002245CD7E|nr:TlpA disulfide reductase family protein [Desulfovibrio mangrovi]UZP66546.1 TlpA family protein disulfide reductase [Desulfovibrio mangrovi]
MKRWLIMMVLAALLTTVMASVVRAEPIKAGEAFPDVALVGDLTDTQKAYLGLQGEGPWTLKDVKADYVLIEVFSMYCPHCQAEAPAVNELFTLLNSSSYAGAMKLIGIGAGNSRFEVQFFRKKYDVSLPVFEDGDMTLHSLLGQPGTPHFYLVNLKNGVLQTAYSETGRMKTPETFLKKQLKAAGLK